MKRSIEYRRKGYLYPAPALIIGTVYNGKPNWSTIAYHGILSANQIMLCVESGHLTAEAIRENGVFSVNIPSSAHAERVDIAGTRSGRRADKSELFEHSLFSSLVPLVDEFLLSYVCKLDNTVEANGKSYFYATVTDILADDSLMKDGVIDLKKLDPLLFDWSGYYGVGDRCGTPFSKHP